MLEYSTDGTTWNNMALSLTGGTNDYGLVVKSNSASTNTISGYYVSDNVVNSGESVLAGQDWYTDLSASITAPSAANDTNFAIRMVNASTGSDCVSTKNTALNNTSGNWRFDNVTVSGTALVPEPGTYGLFACGLIILTAIAHRRRINA